MQGHAGWPDFQENPPQNEVGSKGRPAICVQSCESNRDSGAKCPVG
jgi:hypothetical protein